MKKHQLLEKAMRDYPAGQTVQPPASEDKLEVTGTYFIDGGDVICLTGDTDTDFYVYLNGKWAEIVKPSILDGKVAIQVNNEREFELLMKHYQSKGWKWKKNHNPFVAESLGLYPFFISYQDQFTGWKCTIIGEYKYTIITFEEFAAEIGIEKPVFAMMSEDGVPIYYNDEFHYVWKWDGVWQILNTYSFNPEDVSLSSFNEKYNKAFHSIDAAEKWIEEQNKPKEIIFDQPLKQTKIQSDKVHFFSLIHKAENNCLHP